MRMDSRFHRLVTECARVVNIFFEMQWISHIPEHARQEFDHLAYYSWRGRRGAMKRRRILNGITDAKGVFGFSAKEKPASKKQDP